MGRLPFWLIIGLFSGFMLLVFVQSEWHRLSRPDDPLEREFLLFTYVIGIGSAYLLVRAVLTVVAELRERRRQRTPDVHL